MEVGQRMIEILKFCEGPGAAPGYDRPFNHNGFTYATDGQIVVRVPQQPMWPERAFLLPGMATLLFDHARLPAAMWSDAMKAKQCSCNEAFIQYGRHCVALKYARLMNTLPGLQLAPDASELGRPIRFKFTVDGTANAAPYIGLGFVRGWVK